MKLLAFGMVLGPSLEIAIGSSWFEISHDSAANASVVTQLASCLPADAAATAVGAFHVDRAVAARIHLHLGSATALHLDATAVDVDRAAISVLDLDASNRWCSHRDGQQGGASKS